MSNATPSRIGQINAAGDANALFLKVFSGEVLSAFERENQMLGMTSVRSITSGKSAQFPVTGTISSGYHTIGNEILGSSVNKNEKIINIDAVDKNLLNLAVLAGRTTTANVTGGNAGLKIVSATAKTSASALVTAIFDAIQNLDEKDVPSQGRYIVVAPDQYYQLCNLDSLISRDFSANAGDRAKGTVVAIGGVPVIKSNTAVSSFTDQSAASTAGTNNTYIGDFSTVAGVVFHSSAVGTVKLKDLVLESTYDPRRLGTLLTARMALGHGILRPESAVVIQTAA